MPRPESIITAVLLTALVAFGPLSTDTYLPALPGLVHAFNTDVGHVQLTLSIFLSGFAVAQLFVGPLSDRFGRRPVLITGLVLYIIATAVCAFSTTIGELIVARLFQAIGACAGAVIGRAVVRDIYGVDSAKILAYMGTAMATAPMVAPILGGYLLVWYGWQSIFAVLFVFGVSLLVLVVRLLQETNVHKNPDAVNLSHMVANYRQLLGQRLFIGYVLTNTFIFSGLFCFISGSSCVLIDFLGVAPDNFGLFFGIVVLGYIIGTLTAGRLTRKLGVDRLILVGCCVSLVSGVVMFGLASSGIVSIGAVIAPMFCFMIGVGLVMPNAMAGAIGPFSRMAGAASALVGFMQMGTAALVSIGVAQLHDGTQVPMVSAIALMGLLGTISYLVLIRKS